MIDFETLMQYKPKIPFRIVEKDLSQWEEMRRKTYFSEEDMRIDHSNDRLKKGEIEIPVYKDNTIRPLNFKGKLLSYDVENYGCGFYKITQKRGIVKPNPNDHRYPKEEVKRDGIYTFYIGYSREEETYKFFESEKTFFELYKPVEELKMSEEVQELINDFIDFAQWFWSPRFKVEYNFGSVIADQTYGDYLRLIEYLEENMEMLRSYHLLLNIFGDIDDKTYEYILNSLETLELHMQNAKTHILTHFPDPSEKVNHLNDPERGKPLSQLHQYIELRIAQRGYFVDLNEKKAYPNMWEVFYSQQFSKEFESDSSKQERLSELLKKAIENHQTYFPYK
ncbi:hypothetical protein [Saccharococcus thermophilus]|uniref:Uncharacterized protein n=1 Tax=Saccharococcus thermophilus TaxID=29396 RepID=A0A846MLQ8_9BACL|nr:hypothetical protein [Saccharococcus thermophilus]NIK16591.1 hypothetical protein [Saccharococcus thermophilus]NIK16599.1 hypothetical protein [Saccharococcus thermophilus]